MAIERRPTNNRFKRALDRLLGFDSLNWEYDVPDILDHTIHQPLGVEIKLRGPQDDLDVTCITPQGNLPFKAILPDGIKIAVGHGTLIGFRSNWERKTVVVPRNLRLPEFIPAFSILHEGAHMWSKFDEEWLRQIIDAKRQLHVQLFFGAIGGCTWLSDDPVVREVEITGFQALGEEEQKASGGALYIIGRLRDQGIDPLPHLRNAKELLKPVNYRLRAHECHGMKLQFTEEEVAEFLGGSLPWSIMKEFIDRRLESTLPSAA